MIKLCNEIIAEFAADGFELTLRQLYYQLVSRAVIPNSERSYDNLGALISDARLAGLIDWDAIVDRTRNLQALPHWNEPSEIVAGAAQQFNYDRWADQERRVEVWIEKDALVGVISGVCAQYDVPFFSCRGYTSQSEMWGAAQRIVGHMEDNSQETTVIHLGDHDPSGKDMTRDIEDRLSMFCDTHGCPAPDIRRIALNMPQIRKYNPPPNPAKLTDCRAKGYIAEFGSSSWELDALNPKVIVALVQQHILSLMDKDKFDEATARQQAARAGLQQIADKYPTIEKWLAKRNGHRKGTK
jgi:hypothetical protein